MANRNDEEQKVAERFSENLIRVRKAEGLSQAALADRAGVSVSMIVSAEKANSLPRASTLVRIAGGLGVEISELVSGLDWDPKVGDGAGRFVVSSR